MKTQNKNVKINEEGFAAIVIAITIIIVLSLITVGFAELMRREQRSALDKHLSSQALYAAESGINDASKAVLGGYSKKKTACGVANDSNGNIGVDATQPGADKLSSPSVGASSDGVGYSCLLIDPLPMDLLYAPAPGETKVVQVSGADPSGNPARITRIVISWQQHGGTNDSFIPASPVTHNLPSPASWPTSTGVVRAGLVPLTTDCLSRACMLSKSYVTFLYPRAGAVKNSITGASAYPSFVFSGAADDTTNGPLIDGSCNSASTIRITASATTPMACNVQITGLVASDYLLTLKSIYHQNSIRITAYGSSSQLLHLRNAQTVVDSTGKAQDVLRRVQARIPNRNTYGAPDTALDVMNGICKQLQLVPVSGVNACTP